MLLSRDAVAAALTALPYPIEVYTGPERLRVYDGSGARITVPAPSLGIAQYGYPAWAETCRRFGHETVERWLDGETRTSGDATLRAARAAQVLSGSAATLAALQAAAQLGGGSAAELWCVKWGFEAFVFRCAIVSATATAAYALNVARDLTRAAVAVVAAGEWIGQDYARDPAHVVRPLGVCAAQLGGTTCPVLVTEWTELDEIHRYPDTGSQLFLWRGQRETRDYPLSAEASAHVWREVAANRERYSWKRADGMWCVEQDGLDAGDLVGDGSEAGAIKKVWSRKVITAHPPLAPVSGGACY